MYSAQCTQLQPVFTCRVSSAGLWRMRGLLNIWSSQLFALVKRCGVLGRTLHGQRRQRRQQLQSLWARGRCFHRRCSTTAYIQPGVAGRHAGFVYGRERVPPSVRLRHPLYQQTLSARTVLVQAHSGWVKSQHIFIFLPEKLWRRRRVNFAL